MRYNISIAKNGIQLLQIKKYKVMKRLILMMLLSIIMVGCQKKVDIGPFSLGDDYVSVLLILESKNIQLTKDESILISEGPINVLGITWKKIRCEFSNGRLKYVDMWRDFSNLSRHSTENFKQQMRELCGDGFSYPKKMAVVYGTQSRNNGCTGGIKVDWEEDVFFASIGLAD